MSSDGNVGIWNTAAATKAFVLEGHQKWVWNGVFSTDSEYFISVSSDKTAKLWKMSPTSIVSSSAGVTTSLESHLLKEYRGHDKAVIAVALNDMEN